MKKHIKIGAITGLLLTSQAAHAADSTSISNVQVDLDAQRICYTMNTFRIGQDGTTKYPSNTAGNKTKHCYVLSDPKQLTNLKQNAQGNAELTQALNNLRASVGNLTSSVDTGFTNSARLQRKNTRQIQATEEAVLAKLETLKPTEGAIIRPNPITEFTSNVGQKMKVVDFQGAIGVVTICAFNSANKNQKLIIQYQFNGETRTHSLRPYNATNAPNVEEGRKLRECVTFIANSATIDPLLGGTNGRGQIDAHVKAELIQAN